MVEFLLDDEAVLDADILAASVVGEVDKVSSHGVFCKPSTLSLATTVDVVSMVMLFYKLKLE